MILSQCGRGLETLQGQIQVWRSRADLKTADGTGIIKMTFQGSKSTPFQSKLAEELVSYLL